MPEKRKQLRQLMVLLTKYVSFSNCGNKTNIFTQIRTSVYKSLTQIQKVLNHFIPVD